MHLMAQVLSKALSLIISNFFDAGSCIDGRLTSAWNWCSKLEKKRYYPLFLLTGFVSFDGKF